MNIEVSPQSPCIRNCCLDNENICVGCHRSLEEILAWHKSTSSEKHKILESAVKRKEKEMAKRSIKDLGSN